jgi:hypothetical protein
VLFPLSAAVAIRAKPHKVVQGIKALEAMQVAHFH